MFGHIEVAEGRIWLLPDGIECFAGDLSAEEQSLVWATQGVPDVDLFNQKVPGAAWRSKPSAYVVGTQDRTVHPELERFCAKRMGATTYEVDSSHVPMLSQPAVVIEAISQARLIRSRDLSDTSRLRVTTATDEVSKRCLGELIGSVGAVPVRRDTSQASDRIAVDEIDRRLTRLPGARLRAGCWPVLQLAAAAPSSSTRG